MQGDRKRGIERANWGVCRPGVLFIAARRTPYPRLYISDSPFRAGVGNLHVYVRTGWLLPQRDAVHYTFPIENTEGHCSEITREWPCTMSSAMIRHERASNPRSRSLSFFFSYTPTTSAFSRSRRPHVPHCPISFHSLFSPYLPSFFLVFPHAKLMPFSSPAGPL